MSNESLRVIQLTDLHLDSPAKPLHHREGTTEDTLRHVLEHVRREPKDLVLCTGDLVDRPSVAAYTKLRELLATVECPRHCLPGNHDDPVLAAEILSGPGFHWEPVFERNGWRFVLLNSWIAGEVRGRLSEAELARLERNLAAAPSAPTLVALHHHPLATESPWMDSLMLTNPDALFAVVRRHPQVRVMVWGHIHQDFDLTCDQVRYLGSPSTCMQFEPHAPRFTVADLPPAFRRITLHPHGGVDTEVVYCAT
ncbi:MAG: phosphodiesterase [Thiotrichales bacterium]